MPHCGQTPAAVAVTIWWHLGQRNCVTTADEDGAAAGVIPAGVRMRSRGGDGDGVDEVDGVADVDVVGIADVDADGGVGVGGVGVGGVEIGAVDWPASPLGSEW